MSTGAAVVGTGLTVAGTIAQRNLQAKQAATATAIRNEERRRSIRQNIRQAQVTRARALMSAQGAGTINSSGAVGGIGAVQSNLGSALGYAGQISGLQSNYSSYGRSASNWGAIAGIGSSLFSAGASKGGLNFLFPQEQNDSYPSLDFMET